MKIATIVGARPQFVKAAAVSRILRARQDAQEVLIHTGQHFDENMSRIFFDELQIPQPDYHLGIHSLRHGAMTGRMIEAIESVLLQEKPDCVLVYGDTNSTLAGALAAKKLHLAVAHVEAGMRSYNMQMPEEINRVLTDRVSDILFCSTADAVRNLRREGYAGLGCRIIRSGDVMYDAALHYAKRARETAGMQTHIPFSRFVLCTLHREENTDDKESLRRLVSALNRIHQQVPVVMPLHPRTRKMLDQHKITCALHLIDPVGYLDMLRLIQRCQLVITDSGGLQKEAFFFKKFCITLREETEWVELVKLKVNKLTGTNEEKIIKAFRRFEAKEFNTKAAPYGKGNAAEKIVNELLAI
jgi:UDP-GlcNAc3NAcA epimerase